MCKCEDGMCASVRMACVQVCEDGTSDICTDKHCSISLQCSFHFGALSNILTDLASLSLSPSTGSSPCARTVGARRAHLTPTPLTPLIRMAARRQGGQQQRKR